MECMDFLNLMYPADSLASSPSKAKPPVQHTADRVTTHALDFPVPARERRRCSVATARLSENGGPEVT